MSTSTTFRVSRKEPEVYIQRSNSNFMNSLQHLANYRKNHCTEPLQGTTFSNTSVLGLRENGFVDAVIECYNGHHNLVLRPDDIWTAIMTQFSFYVNKHAEKFRNKFVDFDGKRALEVVVVGSLRSVSYAFLVKEMSYIIDKNLVDPDVKTWILPSFSTTTENDLVTCGVVFMAAMKKYFDYTYGLSCGIPYMTLEGTVKDWENISQRLEKLKEYELVGWYKILKPILEEFVKAKKGNPDIKFWDRICSHRRGGSGTNCISGWITAFCVFNLDGNWQGVIRNRNATREWPIIDTDDIPPAIVEVDVKIDANGTIYYSSMFAGHMAFDLLEGGKTLQPLTGWVICLKQSPEEIEKIAADADLLARQPWRKRRKLAY